MLLNRYGNIDYVLELPFMDGIDQIRKAYSSRLDDSIWQMWLVEYPYLDTKQVKNFEDYKNKMLGKGKKQTDEQMLAMAQMLNAAYGGEVVEVYD